MPTVRDFDRPDRTFSNALGRKVLGHLFAPKRMDILAFTKWLKKLDGDISCIRDFPAAEASFGEFGRLDPRLISALQNKGIKRLYSHQSLSVSLSLKKLDVVIATPTASGKTLCYNLPVIDSILKDKASRALYLFPTKALAHDQLTELGNIVTMVNSDIKYFTYDGDTSISSRRYIRTNGNIVITNPDMLNSGIMPHHTVWECFLRNLRYIVVDELHMYRGVFGSHMANLFARLMRICDFYGSKPIFICCSATIANPKEHAEALIGRHIELIRENGAPSSGRKLIIYNPPIINSEAGIRRSSLFETARITTEAVLNDISTIVFTRSRLNVELLLKTIRAQITGRGGNPDIVSGYRAGYLPKERRAIEMDLRSGKIKGVISTNALELGIDIGSLELAVLHGYPGSISSAWQQIGRAGRRGGLSGAVMVASAMQADQFIAAMPEWFLGAPPELARIAPCNPYIQVMHIKCSASELPFRKGEVFGGRDISMILEYLSKYGVLHFSDRGGTGTYYWNGSAYPASKISLRSATCDRYIIKNASGGQKRESIIGSMDKQSAHTTIFPGAIYFHKGLAYEVLNLDPVKNECLVSSCPAGCYTEGESSEHINITEVFESDGLYGWGKAMVFSAPAIYKKISLHSHKIIGHGRIDLPESQMESTALWIIIPSGFYNSPELAGAMKGISNLLIKTLPMFLMCDQGDIKIQNRLKDPYLKRPAVFIYDNIPGGVGLAEGAYEFRDKIITASIKLLDSCRCRDGCPACVGAPYGDFSMKNVTHRLAEVILLHSKREKPSCYSKEYP